MEETKAEQEQVVCTEMVKEAYYLIDVSNLNGNDSVFSGRLIDVFVASNQKEADEYSAKANENPKYRKFDLFYLARAIKIADCATYQSNGGINELQKIAITKPPKPPKRKMEEQDYSFTNLTSFNGVS